MNLMNFPLLVLVLSFLLLFLAAHLGDLLRNRVVPMKEEVRNDFGVFLGATLTLLGLLIGFSFSMAVSRYDQRKNYEEAEANAIGTEYVDPLLDSQVKFMAWVGREAPVHPE